jgi:peptidyl-prolyl cis-trans isomerase A (cyclophilin A)
MNSTSLALALALTLPVGLAQAADGKFTALAAKGSELYATFETSKGNVVVRLFPKDAPKTVANFVGLATGEKPWKDPRTGAAGKGALYDGTLFHRVIPDFMIQGGDPQGSGMGGPGYAFEDEFQSGRKFDKVGILAMANAGPGTNGSQFFITTSTPAHLNNRHTIFGEVISGYDVVVAISTVDTRGTSRPVEPVVLKKISISQKPPAGAAKPAAAPKAPAEPKAVK